MNFEGNKQNKFADMFLRWGFVACEVIFEYFPTPVGTFK